MLIPPKVATGGNEKDGQYAHIPSIEFILERNRKLQADPASSHLFRDALAEIEEGYEGMWKAGVYHKWEVMDKVNQLRAKKLLKAQGEEELERIHRETDYVDMNVDKERRKMETFLNSANGKQYVNTVAILIVEYIRRLSLILTVKDTITGRNTTTRGVMDPNITWQGQGHGQGQSQISGKRRAKKPKM